MVIKVEVTDEIIKRSTPCVSKNCPIANALNLCLKAGTYISVGLHTFAIYSFNSKETYRGYTNESMKRIIKEFDDKGTLKPTTFYIAIPSELLSEETKSETEN